MAQVERTIRFRRDLTEIFVYLGERNIEAARTTVRKIGVALERLAEFPNLGRSRDELGAGLRSFVVGNYVIFYRHTSGGIRAVRILHGARDIEAIFRETEK